MMSECKCSRCNIQLDEYSSYEYRGVLSCEDCFDEVIEMRDFKRNEIMREEESKLRRLKGLDLKDSIIGKANRKLMSGAIEVASKESERLNEYERGQ